MYSRAPKIPGRPCRRRSHKSIRSLRRSTIAAACFGLALSVGAISWSAEALSKTGDGQATAILRGAEQSAPVTPVVVDVDLRDLPLHKAWKPGDPVREVPRRQYPRARPDAAPWTVPPGTPDPLLERQAAAEGAATAKAFGTPGLNFEGISYTGVVPPDTVGEIGPDHYIQMVNNFDSSTVIVFDKNGAIQAGPFLLSSLWSGGGPCRFGSGDPIVLYDTLADRWLMSEFASVGNHLCVYVSQTFDPIAGGWFVYDFRVPNFPDYPKYAVWPDAYYVSSNEFSPAAYALDRDQMLNGLPATFQRFTATDLGGFPFQALIPSDLDGATPPPPGSPNYFMRHRDDEVHNPGSDDPTQDFLEIWEFDVDFVTPANSTFTLATTIPVAEFDSDLCGLFSFECFQQPGTATGLDPLREVVMWRLQYRNFGTHETLVGNFVTDVDGTDHGGIRWFELRKTGANPWSLFQEGTYAPDDDSRWMGSIAMDGDGNIALGYSVSSTSLFPSIRYTGRLAGDPLGSMPQGENSILEGNFSQSGITRWGDYSSMNVDPVDDCTFWYTNEYMANGANQWSTRIARFSFAGCTQEETFGATLTNVFVVFAACINLTTNDVALAAVNPDNASWDCEAAGLGFIPGDLVAALGISGALSGPDPVGGSITGATPIGALCTNLSQVQSVFVPVPPGDNSWDCEAAGLIVAPGDAVRVIGVATAD